MSDYTAALGGFAPRTEVMSADARKAFDKYLHDYRGDLSDIEHLAQTMFNAGGRVMLATTKEFSFMEARLTRLERQVGEVLAIWRMVAPRDNDAVAG